MFFSRKYPVIQTGRLTLRLPVMADHAAWAQVRRASADFLDPWEPVRKSDYLSRHAFKSRVVCCRRAFRERRAIQLLLIRREDSQVVGGITLDNIQTGVSQACTIGYWMGEAFTRQGYMSEALDATVRYAFNELDLSRIQAGCLPDNAPSRALLEKSGFKYEGVAQSYLQIAGRWRNHVLYANLRRDRRGRTDAS
ncbi:MAG: GNAT family N-acetyltransferase [Alphaproteobacteria bacterium]